MIINTSNLALGDSLFAMFKGEPGTGKSIAAHSWPDTFTFDFDRKMRPVKNYYRSRVFDYEQFDDLMSVFYRFDELDKYCPYKAIIGDSLTSLADLSIDTMINTRDTSSKRIMRGGIELAQVEDYGGESRALTMFMDRLKKLNIRWGVTCIITAHVLRTEQFDIKKQITHESRSLMTAGKKIAAKLPKDFDEAYHFNVEASMEAGKEASYTIRTKHSGNDWARTSLPIPARIDFTDGNLHDIIKGHLEHDGMIVRF